MKNYYAKWKAGPESKAIDKFMQIRKSASSFV